MLQKRLTSLEQLHYESKSLEIGGLISKFREHALARSFGN